MSHGNEFARNYGFWNRNEQDAVSDATIALGGAGGDGYQLGLKLAMMGVRNFRLADPEVFELENSNRVPGAVSSNMGRNKAEVLAENILDMRPDANITIYTEGVTVDNVEEFVHGATMTIDETELTYPHIGTAIAREARKNNIPNLFVMNIGFAAVATSFAPNSKYTFERMMGFSDNMPLDEVAEVQVDFSRCLPYIPEYGDMDTLLAVQNGAKLPSISQGVDMASAIGSTEAFLHLAGSQGNHRRKPTWAPRFRYMDAYTGRSGTVRNAQLGYYAGALVMAARSKLGLNPRGDYKDAHLL